MDIAQIIIDAFIFILPAYVANSTAALFGKGTPIDLGKKLKDGRRIFGDGKTFSGFALGLFFGTVAGTVEGYLLTGTVGFYAALGFLLSAGALCGDLAASFVKRRLGMPRGHKAFPLDQLDFIAGSLAFASLLVIPKIEIIFVLVVATPLIHLAFNIIGYKLKCKPVPH